MGGLQALSRGFRPTPDIARFCANTFSESSRVARSWEIFPNPRWVRFNEMEYAVPVERGVEAFLAVKDLIEREQLDVLFPIEYRYVRGDDIPLSPFVGRDCAVISCHVYRGKSYERYFRAVEAIMLEHGGRPHWGKMHALEAPQLRCLYPRGRASWSCGRDSIHAGVSCPLTPRGSSVSPTRGTALNAAAASLSHAQGLLRAEGVEALDDPRDLLGEL